MRSWIVDLNGDGRNDIVYSDCDTGWSHVYWVEDTGKRPRWKRHLLEDPPTRPGDVPGTGSFHSLGVADFDSDGDLDLFVAMPTRWATTRYGQVVVLVNDGKGHFSRLITNSPGFAA